jgi:acyl carrier protein
LSSIDDGFSPATNAAWDSMQSMNLVMALEEEYGARFSTREIAAMNSVGKVREVLRSKGFPDA